MDYLPVELLSRIIRSAVLLHPVPSSILAVKSSWKVIGQPFLDRNLEFDRPSQLDSFSECFGRPYFGGGTSIKRIISPISISFGRGLSDHGIHTFYEVVAACDQTLLESFSLHITCQRGSDRYYLFDLLKFVNPKRFEWSAQDPDSHFSLAVDGPAVDTLALVLGTRWSRLEQITLTNIDCSGTSVFDGFDNDVHPRLTRIVIAQTIHVRPYDVVAALARLPNLNRMQLVDVYVSSIWERRMRIFDLITASETKISGNWMPNETPFTASRLQDTIQCVVQRQRLEGGDRGDDMPTAID